MNARNPHARLARPLLLALLLASVISCRGVAVEESTLMLVETAPVETQLDNADLPEAWEVWIDMVEGARESIDLMHFYASNRPGSRLEDVISAIEAAASRGVAVRFLADDGFYETYPETLDRLDAHERIEVRRYDLRARTGGVLHAKAMIVDGVDAFLGSQNFDWRALEHIQELGVRCRDAEVAGAIRAVFELDWQLATGEEASTTIAASFPVSVAAKGGGSSQVMPVFSPRDLLPAGAEWDLPHLVRWIDGAERDVCVQLLSYGIRDQDGNEFDDLDAALRRAAARGVEVRLLLADWSKRRWAIGTLQDLQQVPNISVRLATIPQASTGFVPYGRVIHCKYMVVDGARAWVGTSNWSGDYFYASRNVGLLIEGGAAPVRLWDFFRDNWKSPYAYDVDPEADYEAPRIGE